VSIGVLATTIFSYSRTSKSSQRSITAYAGACKRDLACLISAEQRSACARAWLKCARASTAPPAPQASTGTRCEAPFGFPAAATWLLGASPQHCSPAARTHASAPRLARVRRAALRDSTQHGRAHASGEGREICGRRPSAVASSRRSRIASARTDASICGGPETCKRSRAIRTVRGARE
jgi:hypothetical protein